MESYTLNNINRDDKQQKLYNIFQKTVVDNKDKPILETTVFSGEEMRIDKISDRIYGTTKFEEELMVLNNILNSYSINVGDTIKYFLPGYETTMQEVEKSSDQDIVKSLANPNKNTRKDPNRNDNLIPTIKPANLTSVDVNKNNKTTCI